MSVQKKHPFQNHPLANGSTVSISRDGRHQYWIGDNGPKMKSVTGLLRHIEGDTFGIGMNWSLKKARENGGDLNAPRRLSKEARDIGTRLHEDIHTYIETGAVAETPAFVAWFRIIGERARWLTSERFLYHPALSYGGTLDAISYNGDGRPALHDWKSVDASSWAEHGSSLRMNKDSAQIAAYADALHAMGSVWAPSKAFITYVMRDGSGAEVVAVDLERGLQLFRASRELFMLTKGVEQ